MQHHEGAPAGDIVGEIEDLSSASDDCGDPKVPLTLADLSESARRKAVARAVARGGGENTTLAIVRVLHREACRRGRDGYIDPTSGLHVFTAKALRRNACCGNKCRHCPHNYCNVPNAKADTLQYECP
jgi:hypothetical protein